MPSEVTRVGNTTFITTADNQFIKKLTNKDFQINEDFVGDPEKVDLNSVNTKRVDVREGAELVSNSGQLETQIIKVYLAKYRKGQCEWDNPIFHRVFEEGGSIELDQWEFLYSNETHSVFSLFSTDLPTTLPFDGDLPTVEFAPFIRYESFQVTWNRKTCVYSPNFVTSFSDTVGLGEWEVTSSGEDECIFSYTKNTPFGCDNTIPSVGDIDLGEACSCIPDDSSSSSSNSSSSSAFKSSSSSDSSDSSDSTESSSLNSSSSEERLSAKNIDTLYFRMSGDPFTNNQYVLSAVGGSPFVWQATNHDASTLTTGTVSLSMNESGRFLLSMNVIVDDCPIVISNSLLSNIKNENFAAFGTYLKGISPIDKTKITTKCVIDDVEVDDYDCVISHESMEKLNGTNKSLGEIIFDYELNEMQVDTEFEKINIYIARAATEKISNPDDVCRGWGFFCLNNNDNGTWSLKTDNELVELEYTEGGAFNLTRRYATSPTTTEEIRMRIPFQDVTNDGVIEYNGFSGLTVVGRNNIEGGVATVTGDDICNDVDTLVAFYANESCGQNPDYFPYVGNLNVTLGGGNWDGKSSYELEFKQINSNLAVWNFSTNSTVDSHEYATLFSQDGVLWKLNIGKVDGVNRSHLFAEFIADGRNEDGFEAIFRKIHKSFVSLNGDWSSSNMTVTISKSE
jgi:hypothetical protein